MPSCAFNEGMRFGRTIVANQKEVPVAKSICCTSLAQSTGIKKPDPKTG